MSLKLFQRYGVREARASSTFGSFSSSEAKTLCLLYLNSHEVSCPARDGNPDYLQVATSRGLKPSSIMQRQVILQACNPEVCLLPPSVHHLSCLTDLAFAA